METEYLPGTVRSRIQDLMKENRITQSELAEKTGCAVSTLSRFISGKTDKLQQKAIIRIARAFNVSTDFLLGVTNASNRKNYEISQLGLSVQAAQNLYTGKANSKVVSALLENPRFAELTYILNQYFDNTLASGFAAQNQVYSTVTSILRNNLPPEKSTPAARNIAGLRNPVYQADLTTVQNLFMSAVREIKKKHENDFTEVQAITKEQTAKLFETLTKGQNLEKPNVTPAQIASAITESISGAGVNTEALENFGQSLSDLMNSMLQAQMKNAADTVKKEDE